MRRLYLKVEMRVAVDTSLEDEEVLDFYWSQLDTSHLCELDDCSVAFIDVGNVEVLEQ